MSPKLIAQCLVAVAIALLPGVVAGQDAVPTMDEIIRVARERQTAVKSGRFEFTADKWNKKGSIGHPSGMGDGLPLNPPEDMETTAERLLLFSAEQLRYESFGPQWNDAKKAFTPFRLTTTWNGSESYVFQDPEGFWNGGIGTRMVFFQGLRTFEPLIWTYRLVDSGWSDFDVRTASVGATLAQAGGEPCVVLEHSIAFSRDTITRRLFLSRDRQFLVTRYEMARDTKVIEQLNIEYDTSPQGIMVPVRWSKIEGDPDAPFTVEQSVVTSYELNLPVAPPPETFALTFPPTTWVQEYRSKEPYIVREDGSRRIITEAEIMRGATYEDLLATPSGQARLVSLKENTSVKWFWVLQGVLVSAILLVAYRRWRAGSRT